MEYGYLSYRNINLSSYTVCLQLHGAEPVGVVERVGTQSFQSAYVQEGATALVSGARSSASFSLWFLLVLDPLTSDVGSQAPPPFRCGIQHILSVASPHQSTQRQPRLHHLF